MPSIASALASVPGVIIIAAAVASESAARNASRMRVTISASAGASTDGMAITASTCTSPPAVAASSRRNASWSVPGSVLTSISASPLPAMTFIFWPTWITFGERVSRSIASSERRMTGSSTRRSSAAAAASGSASARRATSPSPSASKKLATTSVTRAGRPACARRVTAAASLTAGLSSCGIEPWPGVPVARIRVQRMPFSATWIV
jgi:hypothetical protein